MKSAIKLRVLASCYAILSSALVLAQNDVSGKITDNAGAGKAGASVTAGGRGTTSGKFGSYSLSLAGGN